MSPIYKEFLLYMRPHVQKSYGYICFVRTSNMRRIVLYVICKCHVYLRRLYVNHISIEQFYQTDS